MLSPAKILIRALPNVDFVHGFPGIPPGPERPQASIRGTIEIRLNNQTERAKSVKVELRKVETIPGGSRGDEEFVDLIGSSPITLWQAQDENDALSSKDFPFNIRVPETIPPSVALERGAGIKYEIVATLTSKGKKGIFRREVSIPTTHSMPVVIDKHELHSTWPVYAQPESRHIVNDRLTLAVDRGNTCFAPGDRLAIIATLKSDNLSPVVLRGFEFSLRETVVYHTGPQSSAKRNNSQPRITIIGEHKLPISTTLYGGTQQRVELGCIVPSNHTTSSVNSGRHIDIGYTINIKAILDHMNPLVMDLPVTITNWPRHVSAEMIRRIGTAPNLSLKPPTSARAGSSSLLFTLESRSGQNYGPPPPPPSGALPSLPNGGGQIPDFSPGAVVSPPPGATTAGQFSNAASPYTPQQNIPSQVTQTTTLPMSRPPPSTSRTSHEAVDEFGYNRQSSIIAATAPSRQSERYDQGVDDNRASASTFTENQPTDYSVDSESHNRASQYSQSSDFRNSVLQSPTASSARRPRAATRTTLKIVNANNDIPEEESPIQKVASPTAFDDTIQPQTQQALPASPPSTAKWPTAAEEKQRLYEKAKARVDQVQGQTNQFSQDSSPGNSPGQSNGHPSPAKVSSSFDQPAGSDRPRTVSPTPSKTPWPTAEEEKKRLFERAQAKVRQTQGMVAGSSSSPGGLVSRPSHNRTISSNSTQDSHTSSNLGAYASGSPPTISAGAALYSHAMASINRPSSSQGQQSSSRNPTAPRRYASHTGSGVAPPKKSLPEEDKSVLRYLEAKNAVERRQREEITASGGSTQDAPISYEELFGNNSNAPLASTSPSTSAPVSGTTVAVSEKEALRQTYAARDAAASASQSPDPATTQRSASLRSTHSAGPHNPLSEKEIMRRAFEARDSAIRRSGQPPPPTIIPPPPSSLASTLPPPPAASLTSSDHPQISPSGLTPPAPSSPANPPLSEKERMKLAFEARDRAIAAQQGFAPPDYAIPPPEPPQDSLPPAWAPSNNTPLTAAEEKAQLKARYAAEEAGSAGYSPPVAESSLIGHSEDVDEDSVLSQSNETFLRRDPTISAGKKRASQMLTPPPPSPPPLPPPLPPHPPAEYIEETKQVDRRNTILASVTIPPPDFSSPFDLGLDSFGRTNNDSSKH